MTFAVLTPAAGGNIQLGLVDHALTLWQPYAQLMADLEKRFETRSWATSYRGPMAIHASLNTSAEVLDVCMNRVFQDVLINHGYLQRRYAAGENFKLRKALRAGLPIKCVVAVGWLVGIYQTERLRDHEFRKRLLAAYEVEEAPHEWEFGNYANGRYGWLFLNVQKLATPIELPGHRMVWGISHPELPRVPEPQVDRRALNALIGVRK